MLTRVYVHNTVVRISELFIAILGYLGFCGIPSRRFLSHCRTLFGDFPE